MKITLPSQGLRQQPLKDQALASKIDTRMKAIEFASAMSKSKQYTKKEQKQFKEVATKLIQGYSWYFRNGRLIAGGIACSIR